MVLGLGTWEVLLIGTVLLLLFGPEHLPRAMRTLGRWQAKAQRFLSDMEDTLERETKEPVEYPRLEPTEDGTIPADRE